MKSICVIDGQGGGIGAAVIKQLRLRYTDTIDIIALGTNAIATAQMLKAKANRGASGENAIVCTIPAVDIIIGPIGVILANAMMGEVTPKMAAAVAASRAHKLLLPLTQENVTIIGTDPLPLPHLIEEMVDRALEPILTASPGVD